MPLNKWVNGTPRIKSGEAGWEAWILPLCSATLKNTCTMLKIAAFVSLAVFCKKEACWAKLHAGFEPTVLSTRVWQAPLEPQRHLHFFFFLEFITWFQSSSEWESWWWWRCLKLKADSISWHLKDLVDSQKKWIQSDHWRHHKPSSSRLCPPARWETRPVSALFHDGWDTTQLFASVWRWWRLVSAFICCSAVETQQQRSCLKVAEGLMSAGARHFLIFYQLSSCHLRQK